MWQLKHDLVHSTCISCHVVQHILDIFGGKGIFVPFFFKINGFYVVSVPLLTSLLFVPLNIRHHLLRFFVIPLLGGVLILGNAFVIMAFPWLWVMGKLFFSFLWVEESLDYFLFAVNILKFLFFLKNNILKFLI